MPLTAYALKSIFHPAAVSSADSRYPQDSVDRTTHSSQRWTHHRTGDLDRADIEHTDPERTDLEHVRD